MKKISLFLLLTIGLFIASCGGEEKHDAEGTTENNTEETTTVENEHKCGDAGTCDPATCAGKCDSKSSSCDPATCDPATCDHKADNAEHKCADMKCETGKCGGGETSEANVACHMGEKGKCADMKCEEGKCGA